MADVLSLVASIIQVAAFGLSVSRTLHDYGSSVVGAEKRLKGLDKDIDFTSRIISQLGSRLKDPEVQALVSEDTIRLIQEGVAECDAIFQAMQDVIEKIRSSGSMARWIIYFRDSKIELLRSNLDRIKANLNLVMGVMIHGTQIATERGEEHRAKIRALMLEKEHYTQKYLEEKRKYDELLAKVNSTSTLGSISLMIQAEGSSISRNGEDPLPDVKVNGSSRPSDGSPPSAVPTMLLAMASSSGAIPSIPTDEAGISEETTQPGQSLQCTPNLDGTGLCSTNNTAPSSTTVPAIAVSTLTSESSLVIPISSDPVSTPTTNTNIANTRERTTRRRHKALKVARNLAKRAGIGVTVVVGVAFFPVTLSIYWFHRRRKSRVGNAHLPQMAATSYPGDAWEVHEASMWEEEDESGPYEGRHAQSWLWNQPVAPALGPGPDAQAAQQAPAPQQQAYSPPSAYYSSQSIPAELPAMHELNAGSAELELVGRLLRAEQPASFVLSSAELK